MKFTIINKQTNKVVRSGNCPEDWLELQIIDNETEELIIGEELLVDYA